MNLAMNASKTFVKKQCVGSTYFASQRSFISLTHLVTQKQGRRICKAESISAAIFNIQKNFSSTESTEAKVSWKAPILPSEDRKSLVDGEPRPELKQLSEDILNLHDADFSILLELIQIKLGIPLDLIDNVMAGGGVGNGGGGGGGANAAAAVAVEPVKEKDAFDIKLTVVDPKSKIKIIKEVRAMTGLGLKEAKDLVEKAPCVIKEGVKKEDIEALKKILTDAGAVIEII